MARGRRRQSDARRRALPRVGPLCALLLTLACSAGSVAERGAPPPAASESTSAPAPAPPLRAVKMSFATDSGVSSPLWMAKDLGLFENYGIEADLVYIRGGATNTQAIIAGSIDMSLSGAVAAVSANLAGADLRFFATTAVVANQAIVTQPTLTEPEQLRGKTIGLGVAGGSSVPQLGEALRRLGLTLTDVHLLDIPIQGDRLAALVNGSLDAIVVPQAVTELATRQGYHVLLDLAKEGVPNLGQSMVALKSYLDRNPALTRDVLRAFCEAIYVQLTDRALTEQSIARWAKVEDPLQLESMYRASAELLQRKPYPSAAGVQAVLDGLAEQTPAARTARPEQFIDDTPLRELDEAGFIDALWQR